MVRKNCEGVVQQAKLSVVAAAAMQCGNPIYSADPAGIALGLLS